MGQAEEWNRMDLVGFCPQDLRMTAGGDMFLYQPLFFCLKIGIFHVWGTLRSSKDEGGSLYDIRRNESRGC